MSHGLLVERGLEGLDASKFRIVDHTLSLPSKSLQRNGLCGFWASRGPGEDGTWNWAKHLSHK